MKNRFFLTGILLGIILCIISLIPLLSINKDYSLLEIGLGVLNLSGVVLLVSNGTFIKSRAFKFSLIAVALLILGSLFKLMHWPYGDYIFIIGSLFFLVLYSIWFVKKPVCKFLDYLKISWLYVTIFSALIIIFKWSQYNFSLLAYVILWVTIIEFCRTEFKKGTLFS